MYISHNSQWTKISRETDIGDKKKSRVHYQPNAKLTSSKSFKDILNAEMSRDLDKIKQ